MPWILGAGLLVVVGANAAALGYPFWASTGAAATSAATAVGQTSRPARTTQVGDIPRGDHRGPPGAADGLVPDGTTVFDDQVPAVARLDPALLGALRQAASSATHDGITFVVNSGWRSPAYEQQLHDEAVSEYGSEQAAARWVATPATSAHVSGQAVDLGPSDATTWLSQHGAAYGLCQIYRNEPWHFELRPAAIGHGCPAMYADPTQDPRMQGASTSTLGTERVPGRVPPPSTGRTR
jgi:hypothetical protein